MPEYEEIVAEVELPIEAVRLTTKHSGGFLSDPLSLPIVPDEGAKVVLVFTGLMDTDECETPEQVNDRLHGVQELPDSAVMERGAEVSDPRSLDDPNVRYMLRGTLRATKVSLEVVG